MDIFSSPSLSASQYVSHVYSSLNLQDAGRSLLPLLLVSWTHYFIDRMIEVEYRALNQTSYRNFNATLLNETAAIVNAAVQNGTMKSPNYLFATLSANGTTGAGAGGDGGDSTSSGNTSPPPNPRSSLAMYEEFPTLSAEKHGAHDTHRIILYAITGCVSALFCVVIISGVRRL